MESFKIRQQRQCRQFMLTVPPSENGFPNRNYLKHQVIPSIPKTSIADRGLFRASQDSQVLGDIYET
jgi:hypothetical protein